MVQFNSSHVDQESGNEVGFVTEAKQYVLSLDGLPSARVGDVIVREDGGRAIVRSLSSDDLTALSLHHGAPQAGERYTHLKEPRLYSLGDHLFGRVINALGEPVDGGDPLPPGNAPLILDVDAPGIDVRAPIKDQLYTGVTLIDTLLPIAKGQRQLLFGPVKNGKTEFLTDVILNQETFGTICVYAVIGKSLSELERVESRLVRAKGKNIIIAALSDQPSPLIALAPAVAFLIADHFQRKGKDVLVILDDLDMHAKYLREIALLESRLPGRESYPGDLFYEHAHLLERSGAFTRDFGGGSITTLPVIDTDALSSTGIVSTNLMSCTDGHLSFVSTLAAEGVYPAISDEQSITRIGRYAQGLLQKQLSAEVRIILSTTRQQRRYAQFGTQVNKSVERILRQGDIIEEMLRQVPGERIDAAKQVPLLALTLTPFLLDRDEGFVATHKQHLLDGLSSRAELRELTDLALSNTPLQKYLKKITAAEAVFKDLCHV